MPIAAKPIATRIEEIGRLPALDRELFEELRALMAEEFEAVLSAYRQDTPLLLTNIRAALEQQDAASLGGAAHQLKSTSMALGLLRLSGCAQQLESLGRADALAGATDWLGLAEAEYQRVVAWLI